jgi:uncharacterized membrane protein
MSLLKKELPGILLAIAIIIILSLAFSGDAQHGFMLGAGFMITVFVPGYLLMKLLLPNQPQHIQILLGSFLGIGVIPALAYLISAVGFKPISIPVVIIIDIVLLVIVILVQRMKIKDVRKDL